MVKILAFTLLILFGSSLQLWAQQTRKISASVTDTTETTLPGVNVSLIIGNDTIKTITDEYGGFSFSKINADRFVLRLSTVGFHHFEAEYSFSEKERHKRLGNIELRPTSQTLDEVVIKGKPNPIRFMQDTVEYNAGAFNVEEGDNVADLIKQFPGLEIDGDYNVKTMGKEMVKLRVNGRDFFTNNVKDFIGKLPAAIVSKIQIIDDFGDQANFTGLKIGEPIKMLNIVTNPGMNKGGFGNVTGNGGTNDMISSTANFNLWNDTKQRSANLDLSTLNNGAGESNRMGIGISHRDKIGKNIDAGFGYGFGKNSTAFAQEQVLESVSTGGNIINNSQSEGDNGSEYHNLSMSMNLDDKKTFIQTTLSGNFNRSTNLNSSRNNQFGLIRQDLRGSNRMKNSTPSVSGSMILSKKLKNTKNQFSVNATFAMQGNSGSQNISTNTLYYDKDTQVLQKDSLLNRDLITKTDGLNMEFGFNYVIGMKAPKDTLGSRNLSFSYNGSAERSLNEVSTYVLDNLSERSTIVDSLSTLFRSTAFNQSLGINYSYNSKDVRYSFGINASPNFIRNDDLRLSQKTVNNTFNYSPNLNASKTLSRGKTISLNYNGSSINPSIYQLQPIRNSQNLQNITIGNPDLEPAFSHNVNANFNYVHTKSGISLQTGLNGSAIQREIVEHVVLIPDTLNSLKQITRFENINGNYSVGSNYMLNIPIKKNKYSISYSGNIGFSNRAVIFNNQKAFGKGINFSQSLNGNMTIKKFTLRTAVRYSVTNNSNVGFFNRFSPMQTVGIGQINAPAFFKTRNFRTEIDGGLRLKTLNLTTNINYNLTSSDAEGDQLLRNNSDLNVGLRTQLTIKKSYMINFSGNKRMNYGYSLVNENPLILTASINKAFLKDKSLRIGITGNDLLGQGNNISRYISGNTIIDSRNQQQTRIYSININYNLSKFGGRTFRVDAD